jgi:hypothetical protein
MFTLFIAAYKDTYGGISIHAWHRRNYPGKMFIYSFLFVIHIFTGNSKNWRQPRLRCLDENFMYMNNSPCPICRDEYLWFDFRVSYCICTVLGK